MYSPRIYGGFVSWFFLSRLAMANLVNITIDDTNGDYMGNAITYTPVDAWNSGADCQGCTAHPDEASVVNGTWHDGTFNPLPGSNNYPNTVLTASTRFNGTAVYVNCVLARTLSGPTGFSDMSFFIDGELVGAFLKAAPGVDGYDYNVTVYSNTSLSAGLHTLIIQNGHINGNKSLLMLDSVVYTYDAGELPLSSSTASSTTANPTTSSSTNSSNDSASSSSKSTPIGAIVGPVVGVVILAVLAFLTFILCRRRRRNAYVGVQPRSNDGFDSTPRPLANTTTQSAWASDSHAATSPQQASALAHGPQGTAPAASLYNPYGSEPSMAPNRRPQSTLCYDTQSAYTGVAASASAYTGAAASTAAYTGVAPSTAQSSVSRPQYPPSIAALSSGSSGQPSQTSYGSSSSSVPLNRAASSTQGASKYAQQVDSRSDNYGVVAPLTTGHSTRVEPPTSALQDDQEAPPPAYEEESSSGPVMRPQPRRDQKGTRGRGTTSHTNAPSHSGG